MDIHQPAPGHLICGCRVRGADRRLRSIVGVVVGLFTAMCVWAAVATDSAAFLVLAPIALVTMGAAFLEPDHRLEIELRGDQILANGTRVERLVILYGGRALELDGRAEILVHPLTPPEQQVLSDAVEQVTARGSRPPGPIPDELTRLRSMGS